MTFQTDDAITVYVPATDSENTGVFLYASTDEPGDRRQFTKVSDDFFAAFPNAVVVYEIEAGRRWARASQIVR